MGLSLNGKDFNIQGIGEIRLYPVSKLSSVLSSAGISREPRTISMWIRNGTMPKSIFYIGNNRPKNMFSEEQINLIVKVAKKCGIRQGIKFDDTCFPKVIWEEMSKLNKKYIGDVGIDTKEQK